MILGINKLNNSVSIGFRQFSSPSFSSQKQNSDTFEHSDKNVVVKDLNGNNVSAVIINTDNKFFSKEYALQSDNHILGVAKIENDKKEDQIYLAKLYTEPHTNRHYKGAGTELLKCCVEESIKRGFDGKMSVYAANDKLSPFAFYYKNNFVLPQYDERNSLIHYAIHNNLPIDQVIIEPKCQGRMYLDENGAKALLYGKRMYENRSFEEFGKTIIDEIPFSTNLVKTPYKNEYSIMIVDETPNENPSFKESIIITVEEKENKNNEKYYEITDIKDDFSDNKIAKFAIDEVKRIASLKNINLVKLEDTPNYLTKLWFKKYLPEMIRKEDEKIKYIDDESYSDE